MHDYVIVGAGSSGEALAARLSENPSTRVLLLEAGPDYRAAAAPRAMQIPNPFAIITHPDHSRFRYDALLARRSSAQEPRLYWRGRGLLVVATYQTFSRGSVRLTSRDPGVDPEVDIYMLADERDLIRLRDGYMRLQRIVAHDAVQAIIERVASYVTGDSPAGQPADDDLDDWLRRNCQDTQHPVGSCRMGPHDGRNVVDAECRVFGCENLRVIDASIMPEIVRANTHLTAVMIGEHMAARLANASGVANAASPPAP